MNYNPVCFCREAHREAGCLAGWASDSSRGLTANHLTHAGLITPSLITNTGSAQAMGSQPMLLVHFSKLFFSAADVCSGG